MNNDLDHDRKMMSEGIRYAIKFLNATSKDGQAAILGISSYSLNKYLKGHLPSPETLRRISFKTGVPEEVIAAGGPDNMKDNA